MANLFQAWDEDIQALGAAKASDDQIEARRQQLAEHFKAKAKAAGLSSKKIYETLDQFDAYSRQKTTAQDDQLTPEEQEMAQRVKDGTVGAGAMKEVGKRFKDVGLGALSSLSRMGGDVAQTWSDVGDNDKSELSSQIAQGLYNATDDIRSNYSEGTKQAKKDFWSPAGLTMGVAENLGQIAGSATVFGLAGKFAKAREFSRGATLLTAGTVGAPLAYSQGYGQGKENSLDEINKTSNAQLWENVKAEAKAYDDAGGTGEVPYLVGMFKEAGGDLNLMKDLMAENAGNRSGIMTVATEPLAMGVGSVMSRGAAAGGTGVMAKFANAMNNQGMSNELARRIATGGSAAIASQAGKIAATQMAREGVQETAQEGLEGYYAKGEGSRAAGRKGELNRNDWTGDNGNGIVQQGLQGGAIGALMGGGGAYSSITTASKLALEKNGLPEKHDAALVAKEQADAVLVQAANIADADPNNIDAQKAYAEAQDAALVATNDLDQLSAKFNALYTPEEQAVIKAATMEGIAARKKVADDAAKAQKELDDANAKEQADIAAQQAEAIKTQRDAVVNNLAGMVGDDVALSNAVADLGLSEEEANSLLDDAHKVAKKQKKEAAKQPAPATATPKTPFETAVDEAFNADGTRNPKAMTSDIAKKHNIPLKPLVDAIGERITQNEKTNQQKSDEIAFAERQAEIARQSAKKASQAQKAQKDAEKSDVLSEKQQLENTLADFAANNDHDSMVNFLRDYEPTEADKLIKNAYASVEKKKKAEQDAIAATKKAEALKVKESEAKTQAEQKKIAFNQDMANLYAANPDRNPTKAELDSVGKKHGVKSPIELAQAWVKAKNEAKAAKEAAPKLALPSPETATKDERDITVPTGMNINRDNIENSDKEPIIVRSNGQPFQTQEAAEQALKNKSTKKPRKNKAPITPETHKVITVDGGFAIAPVVEIQQPKKPDDNEDGGVIADTPKPNAPVSPTGEQVVDVAPTKPVEDDGIKTKNIKQPKPVDRVVYPDRDNLLTAIAKLKGLDRDDVIRQMGLDRADYGKRAAGLLGVFKKDGTGLSLDAMATTLSGYGYPVNEGGNTPYDNINGTPTPDALLDALRKALFGEDVGTEEYILNKYAAQREADQKEAEEMERLFNGKGSSTWDEADALDTISDITLDEFIKDESAIPENITLQALKEAENEQQINVSNSRQTPNAKTEASSIKNDDEKAISDGKTGQQESKGSTGQDSGIGLNPSFNLNAQTNEELAKRDADNKAAEAKRQAQEKAAKDKAQADKEVSDFRLSGSNAPADIAMAGGQKDMFAPPTRGEREAEKAKPKKDDAVAQQLADAIGVQIEKPSPIFETYKDALDWISEQSKKYASEKAFKATDLYKSVYEQVNLLYEQENLLYKQEKAKISAAKIKQMRDAGIDVGDKVKAFVVGSFLNGQTHYGVVVLRDGYPYVKLNEKVTISSKGKLRDTSFVAWNDRWVKDAPTNTASQDFTISTYTEDTPNEPVKWFSTQSKADEWVAKQNGKTFDIRQSNGRFEIYPAKEQPQDKSVQNNEPVPTKQPETKTELKAKIDFSEASVKLEDVLNKWEAIKKGDIVVTKSGRALIAQSDAKGKMSIRFKVREGGLEEALSVFLVTGNNKVSKMLSEQLKKDTNDALIKKLIGKTPEGKDLYEDGRGVRFTDNGRGVQVGEDVAITMQNGKTVYDVSGRTDEHRTVEEVAARQPKPPLKATASKSEFNKTFGVDESKIDKIAKDFERKSQDNNEVIGYSDKHPSWATKHEKDVGGHIVYSNNDYALLEGFSVANGMPVYTFVSRKQDSRSVYDVESYTGKDLPSTDKDFLVSMKKQHMEESNKKHQLKPNLNFKDGQNVAHSDGVPVELADIATQWLKMLGIESKVFITTIEDTKGQKNADKYGFHGAYAAIRSAGVDPNEGGSTRRLSNGTHYIAIKLHPRMSSNLETLAHEIGHILEKETWKSADVSTKNAIISDFNKWVVTASSKNAKQWVRELRSHTTGKLTDIPNNANAAQLSSYWRSFSEYFADQVAKWATSSEQPRSVVDVFFSKLGGALKKFFASATGKDYLPANSMKKYLDELAKTNNPLQGSYKQQAEEKAEPKQPQQSTSKPTPTASTSSSDLSDEEYIALQKAYNDFKAKTDKINATYSRDVALEIATGLVAEMPDKEDKIRQALIDAIRENQWNRFEINFPKQPIKVETDVELNRALKRLQKALEGTDYTVNGTFNGKSAKLLFSYKSGANGSRESVLIDRVNGKFTSYHVDFDNMGREVLKPLMDATVKWLNGEEIPKMKLGDDSQWDYTTLLSTPRHIDNAFNEAKANAPTVSKSDKLAQSYDEAKTKTMEQRQSESRAEKMADHKKRIDALPIGVRRALSYGIYQDIAESKGDYVDGAYPANLEPNDIGDMTSYYKEKANKEPRNKGATVGYSDSKDYALDRKALRELADNGLYSDSYLGDNKVEPEAKQQPTKEEASKQEANSKTPTLDKHNALMDSVRNGKATAEDFKQSFADISANKDAILLELNALTKDQLLKEGGYAVQYRHKNDKKSEVAEAVYHSMIAEYALGSGITYGMGKNSYENAVQKMVDNTDQQQLDEFAKEYKQMIDGRIEKLKAKDEALKNPTTLNDFRELMRSIMAEGKSRQEAFLSLSAEHRIKYDELEAESTKEARETRKRAAQANINTASQTTDGKIIETKHTRDGYDLFVVQLSDRLSTDDYKKVLSEAKKLGGWYSSYKGGGAIVGFQFKDKEAAQAFLALAGGDTTAAKEQLSQKQDDYADNRSQSAAERLLDMAEKIEAKANEELDRDRKANTARRARFAMSAENEARAKIALAKTMRNIAEAIKNGKAKFLDNIRMKVDVEALRAYITTAKDNEIRSEYDSYAEQVKRKGQPATAATADFATYPTYTLFRSDLAFLGRQLLEIDGLKKLGQQIMMVADDVSDAYLEFAKNNLYKVSRFQTKDSALAAFSSKELAERAIKKSGLTGKAIVLQVKRGENIVILSPSEAINLKVWEGDADKRITLKREFGNQLVESVGRRAGKNNRLLPYQFQYAYDKLKALSRIGIETPSEFRSALREFIALQEEATNNKVREMEMAMVGRKKDGLDFFPTPQAIAQQMIDSAEITPDMAVLEPSAGMGHIADMIRATGAEPDVIEMSGDRRELLQEKGYHLAEVNNFMNMQPRKFFTSGDIFRAPDGVQGIMRGVGHMGSQRVRLEDEQGNRLGLYNRDEVVGVAHRGSWSGYDRIIMNPPFSNRQDAEHVRHAYELLRPNGRIVAIMGEGVFFGSDKKAVEFREWLESVGGTSEKLPDNSFMDSSLPVNTGVNARMVIIDKQDSDNQTNEDKPKFSRKATESDSVPIYRIDNKNFDANNIKPHGLYVSIPSDVSTFDSPHKDVGDTSFAGNASPKNPLNVESFKIQHKRGNDYPMEVSAGVSALKQLVSVQLFERLIKADKAELTATIKEQFPDIDTSQYYDAYELLEVLGAQLAIQEGYDAIIQKNGNDPFNEMVILDNSIIESMSPTDKPKNSKGTGEGLTTTQTRAILVKHFGEKVIKALEAMGLITIMDSPPSWAEPDADGAYHNGKAYLFTDNLSAETVVATFVHELSGHKGFQELMTPTAYASLMRQFNRLVNQGNPIALAAKARAEAAESTLGAQQDEYLPYLLTQQATLNAGRIQQSSVAKVIEQVYRAVKAWLYRTLSAHGFDGVASKLLQPKDITLLAERMIREMGNGTNPSNNTKAKGSQFSQLNTPQTQINAVRKKYEGTSQWMKAPNGQPTKLNEMQWLQVRTPNFKAWFGDWENDAKNASKVVDANGEPMVVYHGTRTKEKFTEFYTFTAGIFGAGAYFTVRKHEAGGYAKGGEIYEAFINVKSPLSLSDKAVMQNYFRPATQDEAISLGYDAVITTTGAEHKIDYVIAFEPTQIKSATSNTGEFNQTNPDIRFSRKAKNPITEGIKSAANDAKNSLPDPIAKSIDNFMAGRILPSSDMANITAKTELSIYKRTIGTQLNTALQLPDFKKVYDMAQRYLQHVAVDAYAALKVAPNLLGKLESWSDLKKDVKKIWPANFIKQKADRAAVASIIFDETLNNELLSDADILKALTRDQRQIYKEARDAIQVSLKNTAKSEMVRKLLAAEAINWSTVESMINQDLPVEQFAQTVRDMVESRIGGFKNELDAILDADPKIKEAFKTGNKNKLIPAQKKELKKALTLKAQIETTEEALKSLNDVEARLETLVEQGYAPLMRFGEYTLTVRDLDGKVKSFFMFESKAEQVRATNAIVARYGKTVNLETDMISKEEFKQFAGMTPETVALFAKETGMDKDEAYQHYLKHAIPARSAMTRMIKRKGTEGFSDDIQRVVASFVMSNARMSAKNIYAAQIEKSIQDIESGKSVKDQAYVMKENVFNPKENFAQLRNFLFLWNLGGSIFFGLLNMTQPYMQTLPHLSQYVPIKEAFDAIIKGSGIAGSAMKNGTAPKGYEAEYNRAVREGVVDPQNVFMLSGVERGKTGASNSAWGVITHTMGLIAQVTESFNRKAVFIAALEVANKKGAVWLKKKGFNSAYDFAKDTVDQTQGVYDKANRSNWANTSVGAPLMVFKQFSINYVEQMVRMWKKEAASGDEGKKAVFLMLAMLASLSGVMGLPFIKDILDVSETTAAFLGNPVNIEREARLALGKDLADPLFNGVLNHFVFNNLGMDIQGRTGMPDLVPWSNALNPTLSAQGRINEFASIAGATGGLIEKGYDATQLIARDEYGAAAKTLAPRFLTSWIDGSKMALTNEVMDRKGNKLFDTTWDEGLVKFIDANPKRMADLSRTKSLEWKDKSIQDYMTTSFKQKLINAMMDKDQAEVNKLMKEIDVWNNARSRYPVYIDLNNIAKAANKKDQTFDARESIPKGMDWMKNERPEM